MAERMKPIAFENAQLLPGLYRNFTGRETRFSQEGERSFCMILGPADAEAMRADGWNIKMTKGDPSRDLEPIPYLNVKVSFQYRPPRIVLVTSTGKSDLDEASCKLLDWAEIKHVDLVVNPSRWENANGSGIKAYLRSIYVEIEELDPFERKYMDIAESDIPEDFDND